MNTVHTEVLGFSTYKRGKHGQQAKKLHRRRHVLVSPKSHSAGRIHQSTYDNSDDLVIWGSRVILRNLQLQFINYLLGFPAVIYDYCSSLYPVLSGC